MLPNVGPASQTVVQHWANIGADTLCIEPMLVYCNFFAGVIVLIA